MQYKPGSVVYLNSGGPPMVVITSDESLVEVVWLDIDNRPQRHSFLNVMVKEKIETKPKPRTYGNYGDVDDSRNE